MEVLQQVFMAVFIVIIFSFLIARLVSPATNEGRNDNSRRDFSKIVLQEMVMAEELKFKTEKSGGEGKRKSKSKKKVRFAVDRHQEVVVSEIVKFDVAEPSETKQVVENSNCDLKEVYVGVGRMEDDLLNSKGLELTEKLPEVEVGVIQNQSEEVQLFREFLADSSSSLVVEKNQVDFLLVEENQVDYPVMEGNQVDSAAGKADDDRTEKGKIESVDQESGKMVVNFGEDKKCVKLMCDDGIDEEEKEREGLISDEEDSDDDDDDWEGVERSDLEKLFAMASNYDMIDDHWKSLESDVQMQLYGLHKVATEGPCHEAQPMALKVSARAKWNAWHRLGSMNPDEAMEQYINLLSEKVPGWSQQIHSFGVYSSEPNTTSILDTSQQERNKELESDSDSHDLIGVSDSVTEDKQ